MKRRFTLLITVLTCMALLFAACEPVNGLNINKVLETNSSLESVEGKASLHIELIAGEDQYDIMLANPMLLGLQQGISFNMDWKRETYNALSMTGELTTMNQSVPVNFYTDGIETVIEVEGINRPLYSNAFEDLHITEDVIKHLSDPEINKAFHEAIVKYLLFNLPNPETIRVDRATIEVNGQKMNVQHLQADVYGDDLLDLLNMYLSELKDDEEGLRDALSALYDFLLPVIDAVIDDNSLYLDKRTIQVIKAYLHNKTLVTEFLYTTITEGLDYAVDEYDEFVNMVATEELKLFSDDTYFKMNTYINSKYEIVQNDYEILLAIGTAKETNESAGIKITASAQYWNQNGDVKADVLSSENGINLNHARVGDAILSAVDGDSVIGQFLTALGLNKKSSLIFLDDGMAIIENGHTMYPAYRLSELLGAETEWSWIEPHSYTLTHYASGTSVTLSEGETVMLVNEEEQELPIAPIEIDFSLYLPVRPVAEAFGYDVIWNEEDKAIILEKTYF